MNRTLKLLIISDVFIFGGWGLIGPIFAIFVNDHLVGGSIIAAGIASAIFLITHSILQIVFAKIFNPKDRLWMLIGGSAALVAVPFLYILSTNVWHIYLAQFAHGLAASFAYPSWSSLFTAHLEKGKRGFQWSIYSSSVGIMTALTAWIGAMIAEAVGFRVVFGITGAIALIGFFILFGLEKRILKKT